MNPRSVCLIAVLIASLMLAASVSAGADEAVIVGNSKALLLKPAKPAGSVILMPGGDGELGIGSDGSLSGNIQNNQLVRTREAYRTAGLAVLVVDANTSLSAAIEYMAAIKRPVSVIAASRGTLRAAEGIARGAKPDALVLTSGLLSDESGARENVTNILHSPGALPPTLVIHHRQDGCRVSSPAGVDPFIRWAAGRARVAWLDGGSEGDGNPCRANSHHGFKGLDAKVVALAAHFRK